MESSGRQTAILVVAILAIGVATSLGAAALLGPHPALTARPPEASFPALAANLTVELVPEAIKARDDGVTDDLAVAGWFQQPFLLGCPVPRLPEVPVIEGCGTLAGWLLAQPESVVHHRGNEMWTSPATGASIDIVFDGPDRDWERPLPPDGDAIPTPAVLLGHFHDPRAPRCQPPNRQECDTEFVVTHVAWANGIDNP